MSNDHQTIRAGKCTLTLTMGGTLRFTDKAGIERTIEDSKLATRLFEAVRDGSGKPSTMQRVDMEPGMPGCVPNTNLYHGNERVKQVPAEAVERKPQHPEALKIF